MHICSGVGNVGTGLVLNISTSLIFAFHLKAWKGKITKCVFTQSTQPAYLQLSPNLVLPSFSGLAGKYRFSYYSRHIIYLIKCVFWHVHYLPDGLTDGREQMLSFCANSDFVHEQQVPVLLWPLCFHVSQWVFPSLHCRAKSQHRWGGPCSWEGRWVAHLPRAVGPSVGINLNIYVARCVCMYMHKQLAGYSYPCSRGLSWCNLLL